jgi:DNA-directed RNA polymerase specialized sigma24 family protein
MSDNRLTGIKLLPKVKLYLRQHFPKLSQADREDIALISLNIFLRKRETLKHPNAELKYLFRISRHEALHLLQSRQKENIIFLDDIDIEEMLLDHSSPEAVAIEKQLAQHTACKIAQAETRLSESLRDIYHLAVVQGMSTRDVARKLNLDKSSVSRRIRKAKAVMSKHLGYACVGGTVASNGTPLSGVIVSARHATVNGNADKDGTNVFGYYFLDRLTPGDHILRATKATFATVERTVTLSAGSNPKQDFQLTNINILPQEAFMTHEELKERVENPGMIENDAESDLVQEHLNLCEECAAIAKRYEAYIRTMVLPIREIDRHLGWLNILRSRLANFQPNKHELTTWDEWHLAVCPICRGRYERLFFYTKPALLTAYASVLALLVIAIALFQLVSYWRLLDSSNAVQVADYHKEPTIISSLEKIPPRDIVRTGYPKSTFKPLSSAKDIYVDWQDDTFAAVVGNFLQETLGAQGHHISKKKESADARISISHRDNNNYVFEYISGYEGFYIHQHISALTSEAARKSVTELITTLNNARR